MNKALVDNFDESINSLKQAIQIIEEAKELYKNNQITAPSQYLSKKLFRIGDYSWLVDSFYQTESYIEEQRLQGYNVIRVPRNGGLVGLRVPIEEKNNNEKNR